MLKNLIPTVLPSFAAACLFVGCAAPLQIAVEPPIGAPGDVIAVRFKNNTNASTRVTIARQTALIVKSTPEGLAVMVPPSQPENTRLAVTSGKQKGSAGFEILGSGTVRYWFELNQNQVRFVSSQPSNEEFRQDKSYSPARLQYELLDQNGEAAVVGFVPDPTDFEVPAQNQQGLSRVTLNQPVMFSINAPAVPGLVRARLSLANAATQFEAKQLGDVTLTPAAR
jgi:hypothetical protein